MINRSFRITSVLVLVLSFAALPSLSFAQATNAPTAPPAAPTPAPVIPVAPAPAAPEAAPDTSGPRPATYTMAQGDTLESIGKQWGLTGRQLQRYNKLNNRQVRRLQIGQVIKIPPASK